MKRKNEKKKSLIKALSMGLVSVLSCFTLSACVGGMGDISTPKYDKPKFDNPYEGKKDEVISDYNSVFLGGIGVYETNNLSPVFYDNYTSNFVNFESLINRQFESLATVIYSSLKKIYNDDSFDGEILGYGNNVNFTFNDVVKTTLYNEENSLKYLNAVEGGYKLERIETPVIDPETNQQQVDADGNPVYSVTYKYSQTEVNSDRAWKNKTVTINEIANALRFIYLNTTKVDASIKDITLVGASDTNVSLLNLKDKYKSFSGSLTSNNDISTIGYTKDFMWNVLYYVAYSIIGEDNIQNSIDASTVVFDGDNLKEVNDENYLSFEKYKAYEKILPEIINNAFKMILENGSAKVGNYYCFDTTNYSNFYDKTMYPILQREEYIFFDDINDICDAEKSKYSSNGEEKDWSNLDPKDIEDFDPDNTKSDEEIANETIQVGSLRKIKKIILIPNIDKSKYNKENFSINDLSICLTTESGRLEVEIITNIVDEKGAKYENKQLKFDDGAFSITLPDGTIVDNNSKNEAKDDSSSTQENMVTSSGHLIVQNIPSTNKYSNYSSIFASEEESNNYKFSSVDRTSTIVSSFKSTSYDVESTKEKINIGRLNVCNNLFSFSNNLTSANGVTSSVMVSTTNENYIEFLFNYYNLGGSKMTTIPNLYLLEFGF